MKKKIFSLITCVALCFCSCENNFDPSIYGQLFSTNFPKTESDYEAYLMGCYIPFSNVWTYNLSGNSQHTMYVPEGGYLRMFDGTSDYGLPWSIGNWGGGWLQLSQGNFENTHLYSAGSSGGSPSHFAKIRDITRFTEIIGVLDQAPEEILSSEKRKNFVGEARLLRGLMMYNLLHIYGPVPVIVDPALIGDSIAERNMIRPTLSEMATFIYDDFAFAVDNMVETAVKGRYTANYARFCLMRHCLNEGEHMSGYYDKSIEMFQALKASGKYSLYTTGGLDAYANQFKQANKFNSEIIMAFSTSASGDGTDTKGDFNPISLYVLPGDVARFEDAANTIPTPYTMYGGGWGQCYNVAPLYYDTYEEGDVRRDVIETHYYQNNADRTLRDRSNVGITWSGFIINKFPQEIPQQFQPTDIPLARWADALLMYAEATARKNNSVPSGDILNETINAVRARAGLAPLSGNTITSYDAFMEAMLAERGHELLYEGCRKIDLIRFNKYRRNCVQTKNLAPTHQYMKIPNYAVIQAADFGRTLTQEYSRPGWDQDI